MTPKLWILSFLCSSCAAISIASKEMAKFNSEEESNPSGFFQDTVPTRTSSINKLALMESKLSDDEFEEYQFYSKFFTSNHDRISYLSIRDDEERRDWLRSKGITPQQNHIPSNVQAAIMRHDIVYGMSKDAVIKSWGDPSQIEFAGRGGYERWTYYSNPGLKDGKKYLYFENNTLSAWESF